MPVFLTAMRHWKLIGLGLLCLLLAIQTVRLGHEKNVSERLRIDLNEVRAERDSLISAAKEAKRLNEQQVQRIVSEQDRISKDVEADLIARLERLRSELRSKAAPRNPGSPQAGSDGKTPSEPVGEARVCYSPDVVLRAAENEERHDQLIRWVEEQLKVVR